MAQSPPAKTPTGPKVSGTRTVVSLIFLVIVLVVCGIELRAGLGQFLTLRAFNSPEVSENSLFKNKSFADAKGMVAAFPSEAEVQKGTHEDVHHFYWYSLLRPLMGKKNPEVFLSVDHSDPPNAVSFYTSTEGEMDAAPADPNAVPSPATMPPGGPSGMMGPPADGPPGMGGRPGGGPPGMGGRPGGGRPPLEGDETNPPAEDAPKTEGEPDAAPTDAAPPDAAPTDAEPTDAAPPDAAPTDAAPTDAAPADAAPTEPDSTTEPASEDVKPETPATPN